MSRLSWEVVHDCDEEDGTPTCWATKSHNEEYGRFLYISFTGKDYNVECKPYSNSDFKVLATCKTLTSAKRWASRYIS